MTREEMIDALVKARMEDMADAGFDVVWTFIEEVLRQELEDCGEDGVVDAYQEWMEGQS